jgi:D-serine deaminase-like pyridoxal phosphate-dependent protein
MERHGEMIAPSRRGPAFDRDPRLGALGGQTRPVHVDDLTTPALVVDLGALDHNIATMSAAWPGAALRPHVKAFKSTALAQRLAAAGHRGFCAATVREVEGLATAGLGDDLLLANESLDLGRLGALVRNGNARVTVAVDSDETVAAAVHGGVREVLIDVNVGLPRCGCAPDDAGRLADLARSAGLAVRGIMGYEGHVVGIVDRDERARRMAESAALVRAAHDDVGGPVVSGGGTGTWDLNDVANELQAGSFTLMDTAYAELDLPFRPAAHVLGTVVSVNRTGGYAVADAGLKALSMDHGLPTIAGARVWFCSDEHVTFGPPDGASFAGWGVGVGDRVRVWPAHIDPTVALHASMAVVDTAESGEIVDVWPVDLRNW